jgi:hypothetical protein
MKLHLNKKLGMVIPACHCSDRGIIKKEDGHPELLGHSETIPPKEPE